jgi:hypothetical protein
MKLVLKQPMLVGERYYESGKIVEVEEVRAKELIELDHAKPYSPPMETADAPAPEKAVAPKTKK